MISTGFRFSERGGVLVVALFFVAIVSAIGLSLIVNAQIEHVVSNNYAKSARATFAAQSGLERVKAYLIYDYRKDPQGWKNDIMIVPPGTPGSVVSTTVWDENEISIPGYPTAGPSFVPYLLPDTIEDFNYPVLFASTTVPTFTPAAGYQVLLRPLPKVPGGVTADPNQICIQAAGFTDISKSVMNMQSRGMNLLEQCIVASDISVWNNIVFSTTPYSSGMGDVRIHGNVHLLGPTSPVPSTTTTITVSGNAAWSNSYRDPGISGPADIPAILSNTIDPDEDARTELGAFIRIRNGLVDSSGSPDLGTAEVPFEGAFGCKDCGGTYGFTSNAYPHVSAHEVAEYDIPSDLSDVLLVPQTETQFRDRVNKVLYPNYSSYLKGLHEYPVGVVYDLPGVQALQLAAPLQSAGEIDMIFDSGTDTSTNLSGKILNASDSIFQVNSQKVSFPQDYLEQTQLDAVGPTDTPLTTVVDSSTTPASGKTFMLTATDTARNIFIVYKEVEPFDRAVDPELDGGTVTVNKHFRRQIHGMVYAPSSNQTTMDNLQLVVDLDGADRDEANGDFAAVTLTSGSTGTSHQLMRKVINALWLASRGLCRDDVLPGTVDDSCFNRTLTDGTSNDGTSFEPSISPTVYDSALTNSLRALNGEGWIIGSGVVQGADTITVDRTDDIRYAGKLTLFTEDSYSGGSAGDVVLEAGPISVNRYEYPAGSGNWFSFPCNNGLGFLTDHNIEMGYPGSTHDQFAGAFYAQNQVHIKKQIQIMGAMVTGSFLFDGGGTPDWYQSMEIPRCLPPEMIGADPIVLTKSQAFVER